MRVLIALFLMIHFTPANSYEDYNTYRYKPKRDPCYRKVIHWNAPQVDPFENTVIVTDPYGTGE